MSKSKRARKVSLTKTTKRSTREHKSALIQKVREALAAAQSVYLLAFPNLRSNGFHRIRADFSQDDSRIFLGKLSLLQLALGRTVEDEYAENLHHFSKQLMGNVGLLLTSRPHHEVEQYFANYEEVEYSRAGSIANEDVDVNNAQLSHYPSSMMEQLRKLGMPVEMKSGIIVLQNQQESWRLCKIGQTLTAEQCKLLQQLEIKLATFRISIQCWWSDGEFHKM